MVAVVPWQALIDDALTNPADDLNVSTESATCASCHDSAEAREHMEVVGSGVFSLTQGAISSSVFENCGGCHGPFEFKDVADVHQVSP